MLACTAAVSSGVQPNWGPSLEVAHLVHGEVLRLCQDLRGQLDLHMQPRSGHYCGDGAGGGGGGEGLTCGTRTRRLGKRSDLVLIEERLIHMRADVEERVAQADYGRCRLRHRTKLACSPRYGCKQTSAQHAPTDRCQSKALCTNSSTRLPSALQKHQNDTLISPQ